MQSSARIPSPTPAGTITSGSTAASGATTPVGSRGAVDTSAVAPRPTPNPGRLTGTPAASNATTVLPGALGAKLFFQISPVDAAKQDELVRIAADHYLEDRDVRRVGREQGLTMADISALRHETLHRFDQAVIDSLGPEQGQNFIALYGASQFVPLAEEFAARCAALGEPLPPTAVGATAIIFSKKLSNPAFPFTPAVLSTLDEEAMKEARKTLSAVQLEAFRKMLAERPYPKP